MRSLSALVAACVVSYSSPSALAAAEPASACPATPPFVFENCGCDTRQEAISNALSQTRIADDNLRTGLAGCFSGVVDIGVKGKKFGEGKLRACLENKTEQYPDYQKELAAIVAKALDESALKYQLWLECYGAWMATRHPKVSPTQNPADVSPAKLDGAKVAFVRRQIYVLDSPDLAYRGKGTTNGNDIMQALQDLSQELKQVWEVHSNSTTEREWAGMKEVLQARPELIIIHRRAFFENPYEERNLIANIERISRSSPKTRFLVYSRHFQTDAAAAAWKQASFEKKKELGEKVYLFTFEPDLPSDFTADATKFKFQDIVRLLMSSRRAAAPS